MFGNTNGRHSIHILRYAVIVTVIALGLSWIVGFFEHHAPASAPTSTAPVPAHATPAPVGAASAPAHASTMIMPTGPITLPAQPLPAGLMPGHARIAIASAPDQQGPWTALGAAVVAAPTASLTTAAPRALAMVAPTTGLMRLRWRGWFDAQIAGSYTLAAQINGGGVDMLDLRVDGIASPILTTSRSCGLWGVCPTTPSTGAGSVALAAGWHLIEATIKTDSGTKADLTFYMRAPNSSTPTVLVPSWPVPAPAQQE